MIKIRIPSYIFQTSINTKCKLDRIRYKEIPEIFDLGGKFKYEDWYLLYLENKAKFEVYLNMCQDIELGYQDMLAKCAETIKKIKPNPTLEEIMYIFIYLYRKGYLSANGKFNFDYNNNQVDIRQGLTIVTGQGVCRNIASMFSDLLLHFNIYNYGITTDGLAESRETILLCDELMELKSDKADNDIFMEHFTKKVEEVGVDDHIMGNHFEVLAHNNRRWYLLDPSCFGISRVISNDNGHPMKDTIRLWSLFAGGYYKTGDVITIYRQFNDKYLKLYTDKRTIHLQQSTFYLCEDKKEEIQEFSDNTAYQKTLIKTWLEEL